MTVLDLISRSLRLLKAINIGDTPTAAETSDALLALNAMVDAWATERLMIFTTARNVYPLAINQGVYQLGPQGPDWIGPRPVWIDAAGLLLANTDPTQIYERPLKKLTNIEWAAIRMKGLTSTLPTALYYDQYFNNADSSTSPVGSGNVALWPVPTQLNSVVLYTPQAVSQFSSLTQPIALPPGYARALPYNLAVELAPEFGAEPSDVVVEIAMESKANIKVSNVVSGMGRLRVDAALRTDGGAFDWTIGETR